MWDRNDAVGALSVQLSMACILCTGAYWFCEGSRSGLVFPLALIPYAPVLYGLNRLFLRRERSVRGLVLFNLAAGLAAFGVMAGDIGWGQWGTMAFAGVACLWLTGQGSGLAVDPPKLPSIILCLDASLVVLILSVAYAAVVQVPAYQLAPACVGCVASLLGVMIWRMGGRLGVRGWSFAGAVFFILLLLVVLLVEFIAAPAGQGVVALWGVISSAVRAGAAGLGRALAWLLSLLPSPSGEGEIDMEPPQAGVPEELGELQADPTAMLVMIVLLAAGVLCLAVWALRMLGRVRVGGGKAGGGVRSRQRRASLRKGLRRLLSSWAAYLRMRVWLVRNQNTPKGLFYLLVFRCRMGPWHKRQGETPREFLLRLRGNVERDQPLAQALEELIPEVEAALYAPPGRTGYAVHAKLIRRRIGISTRRQAVRNGMERLPWRRGRTSGTRTE